MNSLHESLLITSAPAEILVALAIFFCVCGVVLLALSIEAGNYPALRRWFTLPDENRAGAQHDRSPESIPHIWHAIAGEYEYDRAP